MNRLTSQQRKLVYLAGIVILSIPIVVLGMPSTGEPGSGGSLGRLRQQCDLGESTLGQVDPSSVTMNLVLLGMRGVAVNLLWMQHDKQKDTKSWAQMRSTTESIIMLQPHYKDVWRFHAWNLAYNVSAEWDGVADRFYWVKEGTKFAMKGCQRNRRYPELYWDVGDLTGKKIGYSDEWRYFRRFFQEDPDRETFQGRQDTDINPDGKDNYLVAKGWFQQANNAEDQYEQHLMMRALFRSCPSRAQFDYANALNREGIFDEKARIGWEQAFQDWTTDFGKMFFQTPAGELFLEADENDIRDLAKRNHTDVSEIRHWLSRTQNVTNYRYWRMRALSESERETVAAHRKLYHAEQLFKSGDIEKAREELEEGLKSQANVLARFERMTRDDLVVEETLLSIMLWQKILQLEGVPVPEQFPLKELWDSETDRVSELQYEFSLRYGGQLK